MVCRGGFWALVHERFSGGSAMQKFMACATLSRIENHVQAD